MSILNPLATRTPKLTRINYQTSINCITRHRFTLNNITVMKKHWYNEPFYRQVST